LLNIAFIDIFLIDEKMVERLRKTVLAHAANQRHESLDFVESLASLLLERGLPKAEVYRILMENKGFPGTHDSGKPGDEIREGGKHHAIKKSRERRHIKR
jgi:hypothetical protein